MASSFTPELKKLLLDVSCYFERHGKGDHEIWYNPTAENIAILKQINA